MNMRIYCYSNFVQPNCECVFIFFYRSQSQSDTMTDPHNSSWLNSSLNCSDHRRSQYSPSVPHPLTSRDRSYVPDSQESVSSLADKADPTTVTKTFRAGRKAAAQASLASRDKTPNAKSRRKRSRGQKNAGMSVFAGDW